MLTDKGGKIIGSPASWLSWELYAICAFFAIGGNEEVSSQPCMDQGCATCRPRDHFLWHAKLYHLWTPYYVRSSTRYLIGWETWRVAVQHDYLMWPSNKPLQHYAIRRLHMPAYARADMIPWMFPLHLLYSSGFHSHSLEKIWDFDIAHWKIRVAVHTSCSTVVEAQGSKIVCGGGGGAKKRGWPIKKRGWSIKKRNSSLKIYTVENICTSTEMKTKEYKEYNKSAAGQSVSSRNLVFLFDHSQSQGRRTHVRGQSWSTVAQP